MPVSAALTIAAGVVVLALLAGVVARRLSGRRRAGGGLQVRADDLAPAPLAARATLVLFSTEFCARCPQVRRMLREIAATQDGISLADIDLTHRNDLATRYHVLQTPTTFLLDDAGTVVSRWGGVPERRTIVEALSAVPATHAQEHR